jgi:hypothetical protein
MSIEEEMNQRNRQLQQTIVGTTGSPIHSLDTSMRNQTDVESVASESTRRSACACEPVARDRVSERVKARKQSIYDMEDLRNLLYYNLEGHG